MLPRRYSLNGECVYCGKKFTAKQLTDEHIVPLALSGDWVIVNGACYPCARLSNELYEGEALQSNMISVPRAILELKRRNAKKKGPIELPPIFPHGTAGQTSVDVSEHRYVKATDYPPVFAMLVIEPAAMLGACYEPRIKPDRSKLKAWFRFIEKGEPTNPIISDEINFPGKYDSDPVLVSVDYTLSDGTRGSLRQNLSVKAFALMLAKIGYCFAVAERGRDGFDGDEIRELLRGDREDVFNFVGGSLNREGLTRRHLHYLALRERQGLLTVIVHLFSSYDAPPYEAVVGIAK